MDNLSSITKSTYIDEGLSALRKAKSKEINTFSDLQNNIVINQNSDHSRKTCWSQIKKRYLNIDDSDNLIKTPLIKLIDFKQNVLNKELTYLKYLNSEKTAYFSVLNYIYPKLDLEKEIELNRNKLVEFLSDHLDYSEATLKKTASSIAKALVDFGFVRSDSSKKINISYYEPDLITFLYALYGEYTKNDYFTSKYNISNPSLEHIQDKADFPKLLFMKPNLVEVYLQQAWKQGYLNYEPRGGLNQYVLKHESLDNFADHITKEVSL